MNRHTLGRGLQILGMAILPFAVVSELVGEVGLGRSMLIALGGVAIFYVGQSLLPRS